MVRSERRGQLLRKGDQRTEHSNISTCELFKALVLTCLQTDLEGDCSPHFFLPISSLKEKCSFVRNIDLGEVHLDLLHGGLNEPLSTRR